MIDHSKLLDLELWSNEELIRKQNRLKLIFHELLGELGNEFSNQTLQDLHFPSKGKKLTQGNDLIGLPYQVLDLIRDFDFDHGLNIRVLNWFGKGIYLFVLCGKVAFQDWDLKSLDFELCQSPSPWDYSEIIEKSSLKNEELTYIQWFKELPIDPETSNSLFLWKKEIEIILTSAKAFLAKKEN